MIILTSVAPTIFLNIGTKHDESTVSIAVVPVSKSGAHKLYIIQKRVVRTELDIYICIITPYCNEYH